MGTVFTGHFEWEGFCFLCIHSHSGFEPSYAFVLFSVFNGPLFCVLSGGRTSERGIGSTVSTRCSPCQLCEGHSIPPIPPPLTCGEYVKQLDYAFFHLISHVGILVLLVICNSLILTLPGTRVEDSALSQTLAGKMIVHPAAS